jgi:hypothetical protein
MGIQKSQKGSHLPDFSTDSLMLERCEEDEDDECWLLQEQTDCGGCQTNSSTGPNNLCRTNVTNYTLAWSSTSVGTDQDLEQAEWLRQNFEDFGLDQAIVVPYQVLLSYPHMTQPNKVYLMDGTVANFTTSGLQEPLYAEEENSTLVAPNFNAYSGTGTKEVIAP